MLWMIIIWWASLSIVCHGHNYLIGQKLNILHSSLSIGKGSYHLTSNKLTHIKTIVMSLTITINLSTKFILSFLLYLLHVSTISVLFTWCSSNSSSYKDIFLSSLSQGGLPSLTTKDFLYQWLNLINISTTTWPLGGLFLRVDILLLMQFFFAEHFTQAPTSAYDFTFTIINPLVFWQYTIPLD